MKRTAPSPSTAGIEEGGVDLWRSGDIYRTVTYDDYPVYYMMGELVLPVDDSVTISDSSASVDAVPVETSGTIEVGKAVSEDKDNWDPLQHHRLHKGRRRQQYPPHLGAVTRDFWENPLTNGPDYAII